MPLGVTRCGVAKSLGDDLVRLSERLSVIAARHDDSSFIDPVTALQAAAEEVARSWCQSSIGYHALVYFDSFQVPPPRAHFSREWGLSGGLQGTTGAWREYAHDDVIAHIEERAGNPDLDALLPDVTEATRLFNDAHDEAVSMLRAELRRDEDDHLRSVLEATLDISILSYDTCLRAQLPSGQFVSRDRLAVDQGVRSAPHQEVIARVVALRSPFHAAGELATQCRRAARHLERLGGDDAPSVGQLHSEGRVVIGHGRSPLWRELKDFVADRLHLPWDEFNRVSVAGVGTTDRLQQMVESSVVAFLVATAEDEAADGSMTARDNVIHEIGLFQGHLGFGRAIVLLEEGCEEFSNIHGLGQIRFPRGNIAAAFEDVRKLLEREGIL